MYSALPFLPPVSFFMAYPNFSGLANLASTCFYHIVVVFFLFTVVHEPCYFSALQANIPIRV